MAIMFLKKVTIGYIARLIVIPKPGKLKNISLRRGVKVEQAAEMKMHAMCMSIKYQVQQ